VARGPAAELPDSGWTSWAPLPLPLYNPEIAVSGNYIYILGGLSNSFYHTGFFRANFQTQTWDTLPSMPLDLEAGGADIIGDTLYVVSGYSDRVGSPVDTMLKYCLSTESWSAGIGPYWWTDTGYNYSPRVVACRGRLYHIGGSYQENTTMASPLVQVYTPGSGWESAAAMHQARTFAQCGVYHDTIWIAGGVDSMIVLNQTEFYVPSAGVWIEDTTIFPFLPESIGGAASGVAGGKLFVHSGQNNAGLLLNHCNFFDFASHSWGMRDSVLLPRVQSAGCALDSNIAFVCGGQDGHFQAFSDCEYLPMATAVEENGARAAGGRTINLSIRPNPASGEATVAYNLPAPGRFAAKLYDVAGRPVWSCRSAAMNQSGDLRLDLRGLPSGVYIFELDSGSAKHDSKLVIRSY
jgi:hypothetical protein